MLIRAAEESFNKGLDALEEGHGREALAFFEAAVELERRFGASPPQARYLSYYGLCLGEAWKRAHEAVKFCRKAVDLEKYNPDLHYNLGRVLLIAGRRREAHRVLVRGSRLQPDHAGIQREMRRMGVRRRPVLPFLPRNNPVNVLLGRIRLV